MQNGSFEQQTKAILTFPFTSLESGIFPDEEENKDRLLTDEDLEQITKLDEKYAELRQKYSLVDLSDRLLNQFKVESSDQQKEVIFALIQMTVIDLIQLQETEEINSVVDNPELLLKAWKQNFLDRHQLDAKERLEFERFCEKRVTVRIINGVNVIFIHDDHTDDLKGRSERMPHIFEMIVTDEETSGVMIEYFAPELKANVKKSSLFAKWQIKRNMKDMGWVMRVFSFNKLANVCKKANKTVFVADIANNPSYMLLRQIISWTNTVAPSYLFGQTFSTALPELIARNPDKAVEASMLIIMMALSMIHSFRMMMGKAVRLNDPSIYEKLFLDAEDARRLFISLSLDSITQEINDSSSGKNLIVAYPQAHIERIQNYHDHRNKIKEALYRLVLAPLEFSTRQYQGDPGNREFSGWKLVKKIPIR